MRHGARCPTCRADLHVCRQCRHYAPKVRGECDHDRADRVTDKASANYCTYFRPARGAWRKNDEGRDHRARDALTQLFGLAEEAGPPVAEARVKSAENARRELDALFGIESDPAPDPGSIAADPQRRER